MHFRRTMLLPLLAAACNTVAGDWPQWRGINRDGFSSEAVGTNWPPEGPRLMWRASVGTGFSSVSISEGRAYTLGNTNGEDTIWCFDARTGKRVWSRSYPARLDPQWYEGGPGATPTIDRRRVYTISKAGDVFCLEAGTGSVLWQRDLRKDGLKPPRWGYAGSPLVWKNLVLFNAGAAGLALEQDTGRVAWCNGTNGAAFASPTLLRLDGKDTILIFAAKHLICLDPATGHELWRQFWETGWDTNITDPLVWGGNILISSFTAGSSLLKLTDGKPETVYTNQTLFNHLSPGIRMGDYLYAFSGEAKKDTDFRCIDIPSGRLQWQTKDPAFGSMICAHGLLIILSEKGELMIGSASPEQFKPLARAKVLSGTCWVPPSFANGLLYIRNAKGELHCLDVAAKSNKRLTGKQW